MRADDPNVAQVELVAQALGDLRDQLVFVGGCAAGLLCTSPKAPPPRITYDVDVIAEVAALAGYHALERQFAKRGFKRDMAPDAPICRWRIGELEVDLMPTDEAILGFSNRWYPEAIRSARPLQLPSGTTIRLISGPAFLATKMEAFVTRGRSDLVGSHDLEDIINVLDGRPTIEDEILSVGGALSAYLAEHFAAIVNHADFDNTLPGLVEYDELYDERIHSIRSRARRIAALKIE